MALRDLDSGINHGEGGLGSIMFLLSGKGNPGNLGNDCHIIPSPMRAIPSPMLISVLIAAPLSVPSVQLCGNNSSLTCRLLDVTAARSYADPTGKLDYTKILQQTIDEVD